MSEKENVQTDDVKDDAVEKDQEKATKKPAPKKKAKKGADADEVLVKNSIEINPKLEEAAGKHVVFGWGRMNPITSGHEKLVDKIKDVARKASATPLVYLTHSQDKKKNPLSYQDKVRLAQLAFGKVIQKSNAKTIIQAMQELNKKYTTVTLVVGADRVKDFETLLNKYNGKDYNFDTISVVSAGDRADPDSDEAKTMTADAMSASVMRKLASQGDFETFKKGLPKGLASHAQDVFDMVRGGMQIAEELEAEGLLEAVLTFQQRRQRALTMRKYKTKIAAARKRMAKRVATKERLQKKARKKAIAIIRSKVAGEKGKNYGNLSPAEKMMIDQKVAKRKAAIDRIAKRMLPKIRRADIARVSGSKVNEEFELFMEATSEPMQQTPSKRFHQARKADGSIKLDGRFKIFRNKQAALDEITIKTDAEKRLKQQHANEKESLSKEHEREMDALLTRELRKKVRQVNSEAVEFETDAELLSFIEEVAHDIFESIELEESKALAKLIQKSEESGVVFEDINAIFEQALQEEPRGNMTPYQHAFASVNVHLAEARRPSTLTDLDVEEGDKIKFYASKANPRQEATVVGFTKNGKVEVKPKGSNRIVALDWTHEAVFSESVEFEEGFKKGDSITYLNDKGKKVTGIVAKRSTNSPKGYFLDTGEFVSQRRVIESVELDEKTTTMQMIKGLVAKTTGKKKYEYAKDLLQKIVDRKRKEGNGKLKHNITWYAAQVADQIPGVDARTLAAMMEESGAGLEGTKKVTDKYKKDTPGQNINEEFEALFEEVTYKQIKDLEKFADRLLDKFGVDVEFTRHFADRMNDERNNPPITVSELQRFFKKVAQNKATEIKKNAGSEAVLKDIQADLNLPVVIKYNKAKDEFEVVNKTIMRKKNFKTPNTVIKY